MIERLTLGRLLFLCASLEGATGAALMAAPSLVARLLLGSELQAEGRAAARLCGVALVSFGVAAWPSPRPASAWRGMLVYNTLAALYLGGLWVATTMHGVLLLPAAAAHAALAVALWARASDEQYQVHRRD